METQTIPGMVTVAPEVLETIARFSALNVPGVVRLVEKDVDRILGLAGKSVLVQVNDGRVTVDLSIIAGPDISLLRLGRAVQYEVTRAIQNMIGMPVDAVHVHIEDVVYPQAEDRPESLDE
ncbi:MAG TPA: Asp23/Gls24 family envelope stress response protein [Anaerolineae bacterium]|nr:Asp23/Gls24 family envelope stress response protein [Anaerolineae bacterium]HQH37755.1 Asp23/Gls24 family envelope stress response protein [Anaerolineae bacterium]